MFVYLETGNNLCQRGKIQEAIEVFKVNLEHYPSDPNALFYLGEGYWDDGQKEVAVQYYRGSAGIQPPLSASDSEVEITGGREIIILTLL